MDARRHRRISSLADVPPTPTVTSESSTDAPPRLLHFVWLGSEPSATLLDRLDAWAALNPAADVLLWDDAAIEELLAKGPFSEASQLLRASANHAAASDVARFAILETFGGIYLDTDMEACRPVSDLFHYPNGFVVRESRWLLVASALGLPRQSLYARVALDVMADQVHSHGTLTNFMSGPPLITELSRAFTILGTVGPHVLDSWTFFPDNPFRFPRYSRSPLPPYGVHLFAHTWAEGGEMSLSRRVVRLSQVLTPKDIAVGARRNTQLELRRIALDRLASELVKQE